MLQCVVTHQALSPVSTPEFMARVNGPSWLVTGFHYPSTWAINSGVETGLKAFSTAKVKGQGQSHKVQKGDRVAGVGYALYRVPSLKFVLFVCMHCVIALYKCCNKHCAMVLMMICAQTWIMSAISCWSMLPLRSMSYRRNASSSLSDGLPLCVTLIACKDELQVQARQNGIGKERICITTKSSQSEILTRTITLILTVATTHWGRQLAVVSEQRFLSFGSDRISHGRPIRKVTSGPHQGVGP